MMARAALNDTSGCFEADHEYNRQTEKRTDEQNGHTLCFIKKHPLTFFVISAKCCSMTVKIGTNVHLLNDFKPE